MSSLTGFESRTTIALAPAGVLLRIWKIPSAVRSPIFRPQAYREDEYESHKNESTHELGDSFGTSQDGSRAYTLLDVLESTRTSMCARLLRQCLLRPLRNPDALDAAWTPSSVCIEPRLLERLLSPCAAAGTWSALPPGRRWTSPRQDLLAERDSLDPCGTPRLLGGFRSGRSWTGRRSGPPWNCRTLRAHSPAQAEEPSILLTGESDTRGYIRLDKLHELRIRPNILEAYLERERRATGYQNLKIRYNRILGITWRSARGIFRRFPGISSGGSHVPRRAVHDGPPGDLESQINGPGQIVERERDGFLEIRGG